MNRDRARVRSLCIDVNQCLCGGSADTRYIIIGTSMQEPFRRIRRNLFSNQEDNDDEEVSTLVF
jgi:hypothetical protein